MLGLLFEINADPSRAQDALQRFERSTGRTFDNLGKAPKPFDDAILSNRESVRLLSEEMGVHLPRAVSGAIAEMLPAIGGLGGALLGVFAVEEIYKFGKAGVEMLHDLQGETKELKKYWDEIVADQEKLLRNPQTLAEARKDLDETDRRLGQVEGRINSLQKELANAPLVTAKSVADAAQALNLTMTAAALATSRGVIQITSELNSLEAERDRLAARRDDQLKATTKLEQDAAKERASSEEQQDGRREKALERWRMQQIRAMQDAGKVAAEFAKQKEAAATAQNNMAKADLDFALRLEQYGVVEQRQTQNLGQLAPKTEAATTQTKKLSAARKELIGISQTLHHVETFFVSALHAEMGGLESLTQSAAGIGEQFADVISGTKAAAEVKGAFDAALAVEYMAQFIGSWGTDTDALLASAQYGLASAQMFKVAGSGGGSSASRGGGGGGTQSRYGRGGGGGSGSGSGGSGGGNYPASGGVAHVTFINQGVLATKGSLEDLAQAMTPVFSQGVKSGRFQFTATNAVTNGPKQTGH